MTDEERVMYIAIFLAVFLTAAISVLLNIQEETAGEIRLYASSGHYAGSTPAVGKYDPWR